jgi:hypothetical protein
MKKHRFSQVRVYYKDHEESKDVITKQDYIDLLEKSLFSTMINNRLSELTNSSNPPFNYGFSYYGGTFARNKNAYQSFAMTGENQQLEGLKLCWKRTNVLNATASQIANSAEQKVNISRGLKNNIKTGISRKAEDW